MGLFKKKTIKAARLNGFSLIEILVAMAVIAVLVGVAVPYIGQSNEKFAKEEINRLLATIEMVKDLAVLQNREYGLTIDKEGYYFLVLNDEDDTKPARWEIIAEHKALSKHEFPEEVEVNVAIDGENLFKSDEEEVIIFDEDVDIFEDDEDEPKVEPPKIYFLSTGEQNQFSLAIASNHQYESNKNESVFFRIQGSVTGILSYQGPLPGNLYQDIERDYSDFLEDE